MNNNIFKSSKKVNRSYIDFVYDILKSYGEPRSKKSGMERTGIVQDTYGEIFEELVIKNMLKKVKRHRNYDLWEITEKGRTFLINYDKMNTSISIMNSLLNSFSSDAFKY